MVIKNNSFQNFSGSYIPSIEKPSPGCERKNVTFCTTSQDELFKCLDMQKVAYSRRIRPDVRCVKPEGDSKQACINEVAERRADVVTLNPNDLYTASRLVFFSFFFLSSSQLLAFSSFHFLSFSPFVFPLLSFHHREIINGDLLVLVFFLQLSLI